MKFTKRQMKTGNDRLLTLSNLLFDLDEHRFDYTSWVGRDWSGKADLSCGTKACALGWATTIPALRREGLRLRFLTNSYGEKFSTVVNTKKTELRDPFSVAQDLFSLSPAQAEHLFAPDSPQERTAKPWEVANKIREFVFKRQDILNSLR